MRYGQSSGILSGRGDRCPFASSSKLTSTPPDHPTFPSGNDDDHTASNDTYAVVSHSSLARRSASVDPVAVHLHHYLPAPSDSISAAPILYLPPLLSPLPVHVEHDRHSPSEEELSTFSTHLPDIDPASLALHQALHQFKPADAHYAAREYSDAFNWSQLSLSEDVEREWYCVVFRSRRNKESESLSLYQADREAHEEAVRNGGLVMYWYGVPDATGLNLATCVWQSRRHAIKAISGPKHLLAMKHAANAYEVYDLERWVLSKERGDKALYLKRWTGGDVGW